MYWPFATSSVQATVQQVQSEGLPAQLDFQGADLAAVLTALARAGSFNLILAELPPRTVTLQVEGSLPREQVAVMMRSLAESNGLSFEQTESFIRISTVSTTPAPSLAGDASDGGPVQLHVYRLKHARAEVLAGTLESLFGARSARVQDSGLSQRGAPNMLAPLELEPSPSGQTPAPAVPGSVMGPLQVVPDPPTNSLLVRATPHDWAVIEGAIAALDLRPLQVLIELVIAEVRRDRTHELGLSASFRSNNVKGVGGVEGELLGTSTGDLVLEVLDVADLDLDLAISALAASGEVRILSRPAVLAQNNREAHILVGSERPFIQVFRSLPTDAAIRDQIVQYRDVGTSLTLIPTINPDGYVNLEVRQEVSTATSETQFGAPVISTREVGTHLFVRDGQTAVIGGLIDSEVLSSRSGVPILKDIPLLGWLFGSTVQRSTQSELFLFLTPHVIATDDDAEAIRRGVGDRSEAIERLLHDHPPLGLPGDSTKVPGDSVPPPMEST